MTLLRMLAFKPAAAETTASSGGGGTKSAPVASIRSDAKTVRAAPRSAASDAVPASTRQWSDPDWSQLVVELQLAGAVRLLASNCAYLRRDGNTVHLGLDPRSESMLTKQRKETIASALSDCFAEKLLVDITIGAAKAETPIQQESRMADEKLEEARQALEADPNVQTLKTMFGAELKTDTIEILSGDKG